VQCTLQKFIFPPFPCHVLSSKESFRLTTAPFKASKFAKIWWHLDLSIFTLLFLLTLWRLKCLISTWKDSTNKMEQLGILIILAVLPIIGGILYQTMKRFSEEYCFVVNELCKLSQLFPTKGFESNSFLGKIMCMRIGELVVYIFSTTFFAFPMTISLLPFIFDHEPLFLMFCSIFSLPFSSSNYAILTISKICASAMYTVCGVHGATVCLYFFLMLICVGDCVSRITLKLKRGPGFYFANFTKETEKLCAFQKSFMMHRIMEIVTINAREISKDMYGALVIFGALLIASNAYVAIHMYNHVPKIMYVACCLTVFVIFTVNLTFCTLASKPNENTIMFKVMCKRFLVTKHEKLQLASCSPVGFSMGFVGIVKAQTGLTVADSFVSTIATLALMS